MKKLRKNSGFTLVECVVAMAVLAIMTLGLLMILNVTVRQRNANMKLENDVDGQVEKIVQEDGIVTTDIGVDIIDFGSGAQIGGGQMVYYDDPDADLRVGRLEYDTGSVPVVTTDPDNPPPATTAPVQDPNEGLGQAFNSDYFKVYGAADISGMIHINEATNKKVSADGKVYTVTWSVEFYTKSGSQGKSLKIVLPAGSYAISCSAVANGEVAYMADSTVRIQPVNSSGWPPTTYTMADGTTLSTTATFTFNITAENYAAYDCLLYYMTGTGAGSNTNDVSVNINS